MRVLSCFVCLFALAVAMPAGAGEVTIGSGAGTWDYPLSTYYHDARTQVIYLASEIGPAAFISGLALDVATVPGQSLSTFTIRLKHTPLASYATSSWESSGWTVCYQANTTISSTGWAQFNFTTPFAYDGVQNLMVDFSFNNSSYTTSGLCRYSTPSGARSIYSRTDSGYGDPLAWSGTSNPTPTSTTYVPNVRLTAQPVPAATPAFNPDGSVYDQPQQVTITITCSTPGAVIHYTTSGVDPTESDPVVASGGTVSVPVSPPTTLKARAWAPGLDPSGVKTAVYRLPVILFVSPSGSDTNDGLSWAMAKKTVAAALAASDSRDEIWVQAGTYPEKITLKAVVGLYGGFAGSETARDQRNWFVNKTTLDGGGSGVVVKTLSGATASTVLDGFTIRNGGYGIDCNYYSTPTITNNTISGNGSRGIYCFFSFPTITNNTISENGGDGIYCFSYSSPTITNNTISGNGYGIVCDYSSSPFITNNTISGNGQYGIDCWESSPTITNNIVAFNQTGIYKNADSSPVLKNNCVYNPGGVNYDGLTAGAGDINVDPMFVNCAADDYHLLASSPCINAGDDTAVGLGWLDMDGQPRQNGVVDIGADEFWITDVTLPGAKAFQDGRIVRVSGVVVTAVFGNAFYIEAPNRASGIRVQKPGHGLSAGQGVTVSGTMATNLDGERFISADEINPSGTGLITSLTMTTRSLGGADFRVNVTGGQRGVKKDSRGLNNIGLLVRTAGKVTFVDPGGQYFVLSDGSSATDPDGHPGVRVVAPGLIPGGLAVGDGVAVTGISSCYKAGADLYSRVLVRSAADIVPVSP